VCFETAFWSRAWWPRAWQAEATLNVAVIGAGFLGARIITEMLLLGNHVVPPPVVMPNLTAQARNGTHARPFTMQTSPSKETLRLP